MSGKSTIIGITLTAIVVGALLFTLRAFSVDLAYRNSSVLGDEIVVTLGRFVDPERIQRDFAVIPPVDGEMVWLPETREIHFLPLEPLAPDATYRVLTGTRSRLKAALLPQDAVLAFTTTRDETPPVLNPNVTSTRYIDVNLATMQLTLVEDSRPVAVYPVAAKGSPWTSPTREGAFTTLSKEKNHLSTIYGVWMPLSMRYSGSYFIHAWPYWPNGTPIKSRYSGGCIRMLDHDMREVFDWANIGDTFVVHSTPNQTPVFSADTIGDGDLVRVAGTSEVFVLKEDGEKKYKRHVLTERFGDFYPHLARFWPRVKTVSQASVLEPYFTSRWILTENPREKGSRYIYEINAPGVKHLIICGDGPNTDGVAEAWKCEGSWSAHGWPKGELFVASDAELAVYQDGGEIVLPFAPWVQ